MAADTPEATRAALLREQLGLLTSACQAFLANLPEHPIWTGSSIGLDAIQRLVREFDHVALAAADALLDATDAPAESDDGLNLCDTRSLLTPEEYEELQDDVAALRRSRIPPGHIG